jgi:tetratricopeptide (TPR) repeat protein
VYGDEHPEFASGIYNLGRALLITGKVDAAASYLHRALDIDRKRLAAGHEDLILPLNSLGMLEIARGNLAAADRFLGEALENAREHKHWMLSQVLTNVGDLRVRQHEPEAARSALAEARALLVDEYGDDLKGSAAWRLAVLDSVTGGYEIERGKFDEAGKLLGQACPALRARFGKRSYFGDQCLEHLDRLNEIRHKQRTAQAYRSLLENDVAGD